MKNLPIILILILFSCQPQSKPVKQKNLEQPPEEAPPRDVLTGAWEMTNLYSINQYSGDTIFFDQKEYKLYVDGNVMWGIEAATESIEWFGFGKYYIDGDTLRETMSSGSKSFRDVLEERGNKFAFDLNIFGDSYTQIVRYDSIKLYEVYDRIR